jgi:hypothetical protein
MKMYNIDKYLLIQNESMFIIDCELKRLVSVDIAKQLNLPANKRNNSIRIIKTYVKNKIIKYLVNNQHQIVEIL